MQKLEDVWGALESESGKGDDGRIGRSSGVSAALELLGRGCYELTIEARNFWMVTGSQGSNLAKGLAPAMARVSK